MANNKSIKASQKPVKKFCPDCRRVPLTRHRNFYSCPDCGGELWDGLWFAGRKDQEIKIFIADLMQPVWVSRAKKHRSSKSGRRRKKQQKNRPGRSWLDSYN